MLKVVIVGYGDMFMNLIAAALDANCEIVGVFRKERVKYSPIVRKLKDIFNPSFEHNYIKSYNLPEIDARSVNSSEFRKKLLKLNPDIILVGSWCEKIEKATYDIPKIATINAHPSLLPKYRGPNPYFWNIKNQEDVSGVTFHLVDNGYDTGAILAQEEVKIYPSDTGATLKQRTVLTARGVACELLKDLSEDIIIPLTQIEDKSSYYSHPKDLELDFNKSAEENYATIRASYPWCDCWFYHKGIPLVPDVHKTFVEENKTYNTAIGTIIEACPQTKTIAVVCGDGKVLRMSGVKLYNKIDRLFTANFIRREVKVGETIYS